MTRFGIDALTALRLVSEGITISDEHRLVAPNLLRSQALSHVYREVREGRMDEAEARVLLDGITTMRIRLLGDRVSRATAFKVAQQLDWDDTANAEYVAVAQLQADFFVTLDADLAREVEGLVETASFEALRAAATLH
jgi:predicted nucleic acid-binding protein